ncbi:MAG: LacI family DNA-binding transcriptional regulator [Schaedlerella sp.]|nr:LacI family DNA-binding transcriptional regulator [Schaedlerella sp.]
MAVTLKDVALLAGVSPSTVSRTCKNHPSISEETKEKVRRAMAELGYDPSSSASPSSEDKHKTIGIILPPSMKEAYENPFYLETIHGISSCCSQKGYINTVITGNTEEELLSIIQNMTKSGQVDAFILLYSKSDDAVINYLYNEGHLYALIGKATQYANQTIYVDNDNITAGKDAAEYLIQKGHRKIAFIGRNADFLYSADRKTGYQLALVINNIPMNPDFCLELEPESQSHIDAIRKLFFINDRPTAVVVDDDILAFTLKQLCLEAGISIPEDISIVSFNNSLVSRMSYPQLTSMDINSFQLGTEAASQIINHMENPDLMATKIIVPHQLIERQSCKEI